jgi:O-antigen biosynthesis protein WbqP
MERSLKRLFDFGLALLLIILLFVPMLLISVIIKLTSSGPVLYWSDRVGINNTIFKMPKFRTMKVNTPAVATHLLENPDRYLTPIGKFLRKSSLDELPQLFSILKGDISFVGPRPALFNQDDLIELRTQKGIHRLIPGLTGWAQINGRDELPIPRKVEYEEYYLIHRSILFDLKILALTFLKVLRREGVKH